MSRSDHVNREDHVLLVEGRDDKCVLAALLKYHGLEGVCEILEMENVGRLLETFPVRMKQSGLRRYGVVVDANASLDNRWMSLKDSMESKGFSAVPNKPPEDGFVMESPKSGLPRVGVWIMPNNKLPGILEDFVHFLIPAEDKLFAHARKSVLNIPTPELKFKDKDRSKAEIYTWLAWQAEPGKPLGTAITAKFLNAEAKYAISLMKWLHRLFVQP